MRSRRQTRAHFRVFTVLNVACVALSESTGLLVIFATVMSCGRC